MRLACKNLASRRSHIGGSCGGAATRATEKPADSAGDANEPTGVTEDGAV